MSNSILHTEDGTAWYINRYIEAAHFAAGDVRDEIDRLSAKFGERAREIKMPERERLPNAIIAIWGAIQLEPLNAADVSILAAGDSPHKGLLVSFLGDLERSAKAGVPVYRLAGGAGFLWAATFKHDGQGVLRFLAIDASQIDLPATVKNEPSSRSMPSSKVEPPSSGLPPQSSRPAPTPKPPKVLPEDDPFVTDCDAYAASDTDPQRKGAGIPLDKIIPAKAIPACLEALSDYPNSSRFQYQLGRAYERNGEFEQAKTWYGKAAERGNQEARESLNRVENQKLAK